MMMTKKPILLCLDDEKIVLDSLKEQIKSVYGKEFEIEFAQSGEEAFEIIEEYKEESDYDMIMVISDWLMPGMKGDEFLIALHKQYPEVVKIMLTGQADEDAVTRARDEANLYKCLQKPWRKTDLLETISKALNK